MIFDYETEKIRLLVVSDVNMISSTQLVEQIIQNLHAFDLCVVCGPFGCDDITSPENVAAAQGDMASILAQLENVVCRVVYLPGDTDPICTMVNQLHLTPNSVNIHGRSMQVLQDLYVAGFCEKSNNICDFESIDDDEMDSVQVQSSTSVDAIKEVLLDSNQTSGIFILNYKFLHTLNHFLFFTNEALHQSGVSLIIIPSKIIGNINLTNHFQTITIIQPKRLVDGYYCVVELDKDVAPENKSSRKWNVGRVENCIIPGFVKS